MTNSQLIKKFNERFPVGSQFPWRSADYDSVPFKRLTVKYAAFMAHGNAVVFAEEELGYLSIEPQFVDYAAKAEAAS